MQMSGVQWSKTVSGDVSRSDRGQAGAGPCRFCQNARDAIAERDETIRQLRAREAPRLPSIRHTLKTTPKEQRLLELLMARSPHVVTYDSAMAVIWPQEPVTNNTVSTLVARLRRKLKRFRAEIATDAGCGYYLRAADAARIRKTMTP